MQKKLENNMFYQLFLKAAGIGLLAYAVAFAVWTVFFTETGNGDNVEHIHSTWLVSMGKVPYRDFFQHHNPLLWYIFAPLIKLFNNPLALLDAAHGVGLIGGIITFYITYKTCVRFFSSRLGALLSLVVLCPPYYYIYCFNYNPDTFMALFFALGFYNLLAYWQDARLKNLAISFFAFFTAFLFTQKILVVLAFLSVASLFVFYKKKTKLGDIGYALLLPVFGTILFVALLYNADALKIYWISNYPFNIRMQEYYGFNKIAVLDWQMLVIAAGISVLSIICLFFSQNLNYKIVAVLFIIELLLRSFYFSIAPYYMLPLMVYMCCLNSVFIDKINQKCPILLLLIIGVGGYYAAISKPRYVAGRGQDRSFARFLAANITPCDYILNSFLGNQSIMDKDLHYYWAMLGHIDIAGAEMKIAPLPNVNELVIKYKPKLIFTGIYWNNYYKNRGINEPVQQVAPEIVDRFYLPTPFSEFYILKYEYRKKDCRYNPESKEWLYAD